MAEHVCPYWIGYLLASPLRKLFQSPEKLLGPHVKTGMKVLDVGCAMGFFSLPLARLVGPKGKVYCVDVQEKMLQALRKRAIRAGLVERLEPRACLGDSLGLESLGREIDFALLFAVVHEAPDQAKLFGEISKALKPGARTLIAEPRGHVTGDAFEKTLTIAIQNGFEPFKRPPISRCHTALLVKSAIEETP